MSGTMRWKNVNLIFRREVRDQLRDRRTLFTIVVLPMLLYPLLGMSVLQVAQFTREHRSTIRLLGLRELPDAPLLLEDDHFALDLCPEAEARLLQLQRGEEQAVQQDRLREYARAEIQAGRCDAVVFFPPGFGDALAKARSQFRPGSEQTPASGELDAAAIPGPQMLANTASDKSRIAADRVERVLRRWRESIVRQNLMQSNVSPAATQPFALVDTDIAEEVSKRAAVWSKILPFVVLIWALTGAFYPAIDLCAGEKERGTLETLLSSPAQRVEIVWGKLLTVMVFSVSTAVLNLISMCATGSFIVSQLGQMGAAMRIGSPPIEAMFWLILALLPVSALFSALSIAIAAFARSSKEGQYYLMPLLMITLPLMILPLLPAAELDWGSSLIPVSGIMLLLRAAIEGQYHDLLTYAPSVIVVTAGCCWLAIRWAVDQFNNEGVIFREGERWSLGIWLRHLMRDRKPTPSFGAAILCGVSLLLVRFFSSFLMSTPQDWQSFAFALVASQLILIALPALLMTGLLTSSYRQTLLLRWPGFRTLLAAVLLAVTLHPAAVAFSELVQWLYPMNPEVRSAAAKFSHLILDAHWTLRLLALAVIPALCEELAFRGFILSGLRHLGHKWAAIVITSLFFGAVHGWVQQSISACAVGIVIGYVAVQTGSLWPCVLFHVTYNTLSLTLSIHATSWAMEYEWMRWIFAFAEDDFRYQPLVAIAASVSATGFLIWFRALPYRATDEERLQAVLDHQPMQSIAK